MAAPPADDKTAPGRVPDRGVARRQAFLQAAREVFLDQGYEAASVNDVVRLAGGSLATLYAQFGNKEGLFLAVTQDQHERFVQAITPQCVDHLPLEEALQAIGEQYLHTLLARDHLAFFRLMIGEGRKFPQLLQRYISSAGADKVRDVVTAYLKLATPAAKHQELHASYFLALLGARHHYRSLADDSYHISDAELTAHVQETVRFVINGMRDA